MPLYVGVDEALRQGRFDAAIVAVSWGSTASVASVLLTAGVPCLIEKPLGTTCEEGRSIVEAGEGRTAFVAYNLRFQSSVLRALDLVDAFGSPAAVHVDAPEQSILAKMLSGARTAEVARRWLLLNTTHALDLFPLFLGRPIHITAAAPPNISRACSVTMPPCSDHHSAGRAFSAPTGAVLVSGGYEFMDPIIAS